MASLANNEGALPGFCRAIDVQEREGVKPLKQTIGRIAAIILFLGASSAQQNEKDFLRLVPGGFLTAGEFSELPRVEQYGYAMGFVNGMMASGILGADGSNVEILDRCTKDMQAKQVAAIIEKYVKDHPEGWHETLAVHSLDALLSACPDLRKRLLPSQAAPH